MAKLVIVLELAGILIVAVGIGLELRAGSPGALLITAGSLIVAAGAVLWAKFVGRPAP